MGRRANTISDKDWKSIQDRAVKANPERSKIGTKEFVKGATQGRDNFKNRENC